jgi:hypothetical protein
MCDDETRAARILVDLVRGRPRKPLSSLSAGHFNEVFGEVGR